MARTFNEPFIWPLSVIITVKLVAITENNSITCFLLFLCKDMWKQLSLMFICLFL